MPLQVLTQHPPVANCSWFTCSCWRLKQVMDDERTVRADGGVAQPGAAAAGGRRTDEVSFAVASQMKPSQSPWLPPPSVLPLLGAAMKASGCLGSGPSHRRRRPGYMSTARTSTSSASASAFKDTVRKRSNARAEAARLRPRSLHVPFKFWTLGAARGRKWCASGNGQHLISQQSWLLIKSVRSQN